MNKVVEPSLFKAGDLLSNEVFKNISHHLSDLVDTEMMDTVW